MDLHGVFKKERRLLLFAQLIGGGSLQERIRNCAWIIELLKSGDDSWQPDELVSLAQESTPFMPAKEILREIVKLRLLNLDSQTSEYKLSDYTNFFEKELPASVTPHDCSLTLGELRELLQGGPAQRSAWTRSRLSSILHEITDFGFHCIRSWRSMVVNGNELYGVPFLWNVGADGHTTPMGGNPASSATLDIVRLAVEPLNFGGFAPSNEQRELLQWAFDQIYQRIVFIAEAKACFILPGDDSYPNSDHPINDSQCRVIRLFVHLLREEQDYLDTSRRKQAHDSVVGLARYLLSQQLQAPGEKFDGFWSFHRYDNGKIDSAQVLTINSEQAVTAFMELWSIASDDLKTDIAHGITRILSALCRTAHRDSNSIAWQKHFSTLTRPTQEMSTEVERHACESFATARAMLIFATAKAMALCDDGRDYIRGAIRFLENNWIVNLKSLEDDVEFIPYRTPENSKWSDMTYRITNPISAIMPYYILKSSRLCRSRIPILLTEPLNNCMNFALENYGGNGFWRDAPTGLAYPTNTAFNMEMLMEYLQACEE